VEALSDLIRIDGSEGEGGGQILRTALTLSMVTGRPFELFNLRARRPKPGLQPQHLLCVKASAKITSATLDGAKLGSTTVRFEPGAIRPGTYDFDIGTAGSTSLVLQTLCVPLAFAGLRQAQAAPSLPTGGGRTILTITGGTHVPFSPTFHFLSHQWAVLLRRLGVDIELEILRAGYYPQGGGEVRAKIRPVPSVQPLRLGPRGPLERLEGISAVSNLPRSVAERQRARALERLEAAGLSAGIELVELPSHGKGTLLFLLSCHEGGGRACYDALGKIGKRAEEVADDACDGLLRFLQSQGAVDEHAADQLLLPLALASGPSELPVPVVTNHLLTNGRVIERFVASQVRIEGDLGGEGRATIVPPPTC
jgi:RNA 3'-terminal phosphate cyclase (ATP)